MAFACRNSCVVMLVQAFSPQNKSKLAIANIPLARPRTPNNFFFSFSFDSPSFLLLSLFGRFHHVRSLKSNQSSANPPFVPNYRGGAGPIDGSSLLVSSNCNSVLTFPTIRTPQRLVFILEIALAFCLGFI